MTGLWYGLNCVHWRISTNIPFCADLPGRIPVEQVDDSQQVTIHTYQQQLPRMRFKKLAGVAGMQQPPYQLKGLSCLITTQESHSPNLHSWHTLKQFVYLHTAIYHEKLLLPRSIKLHIRATVHAMLLSHTHYAA